MSTAPLVALVAAIAGPLIAYIVAARKMSGKIGTSEAESLWTESRDIRKEYRAEIIILKARLGLLEDRVAELVAENMKLRDENLGLREENFRMSRRGVK